MKFRPLRENMTIARAEWRLFMLYYHQCKLWECNKLFSYLFSTIITASQHSWTYDTMDDWINHLELKKLREFSPYCHRVRNKTWQSKIMIDSLECMRKVRFNPGNEISISWPGSDVSRTTADFSAHHTPVVLFVVGYQGFLHSHLANELSWCGS